MVTDAINTGNIKVDWKETLDSGIGRTIWNRGNFRILEGKWPGDGKTFPKLG